MHTLEHTHTHTGWAHTSKKGLEEVKRSLRIQICKWAKGMQRLNVKNKLQRLLFHYPLLVILAHSKSARFGKIRTFQERTLE